MTMQDLEFKHPTAYDWSASFQRELPFDVAVDVTYVGRMGLHLQRERNINQLLPGTLQANPGVNVNALRPYTGFGVIRLSENAGRSIYHGLQIGLERRFRGGLGFGAAYTLSQLRDNASGKRAILFNAYDDSGYWGISDNDRTHVINFHYLYELPYGRSQDTTLKKILGGWQVSGVTFFQSGRPLTIWRGDDIAGVGESTPQPWNLVGDPHVADPQFSQGVGKDQNFWFNPAAFAAPSPGTFGNGGRNIMRAPWFTNWDIALFQTVGMGGKRRLQLRAEFFNFLNHPNLGDPNNGNATDAVNGGISIDPRSASFGGTDPAALAMPLSYLHHYHGMKPEMRVRARPELYVEMNLIPKDRLDKKGRWLGFRYVQSKLIELSIVSVPANPDAVQLARNLDLPPQLMRTFFADAAPAVHGPTVLRRKLAELDLLRMRGA